MKHTLTQLTLTSGLFVLSSLSSFNVEAGEEKKGHQNKNNYAWVDTWDENKDHSVSIEEFFNLRQARFNLADENGNGQLSLEEYSLEFENRLDSKISEERKGSVKQTRTRFNAMDKDKNGAMSHEEYMKVAQRGFAFWDTDKDQVISDKDETPSFNRSRANDERSEQEKEAERIKWRIAGEKRVVRMPTHHNKKGVFTMYDTNKDQRIEHAEYMAIREAKFKETDENNNGELSFDEYLAEFENRVDTRAKKIRSKQVKQVSVRFGFLDVNNDQTISFAEYQLSGIKTFNRRDINQDGKVNFEESKPAKAMTRLADKSTEKTKS